MRSYCAGFFQPLQGFWLLLQVKSLEVLSEAAIKLKKAVPKNTVSWLCFQKLLIIFYNNLGFN